MGILHLLHSRKILNTVVKYVTCIFVQIKVILTDADNLILLYKLFLKMILYKILYKTI